MADITNVQRSVPNTVNEVAAYAKSAGLSEKATQVISNVSAILANRSVTVTVSGGVNGAEQPGVPGGATGVPALDNPADLKQLEADLEKLLAYLQLDNDERQAEMAKERIEIQKDTMAAEHKERQEKIKESLEKMDDAAKSRLATRIFGWIGAIIAVAAAAAAIVFTGGAAAVFACAGAAVAVGALIMSETGATDKLIGAIAESMEKAGMDSTTAKIVASLVVNLTIMAISLGCSIGGLAAGLSSTGKALIDLVGTAATVAKTVQTATSVASTAVGIGSIAAGFTATAMSYKSDMAKADLTELEKIMTELQRRLDESEEELNALLEAIQNGLSRIAALLDSATDTEADIANNIGNMA